MLSSIYDDIFYKMYLNLNITRNIILEIILFAIENERN